MKTNDEKSKQQGGSDHINISDENELHYWATQLGVSEDNLKRAVIDVGSDSKLVKEQVRSKYLN